MNIVSALKSFGMFNRREFLAKTSVSAILEAGIWIYITDTIFRREFYTKEMEQTLI
jgi:hypothetical protein